MNVMISGFGWCQVQRRDLVFSQANAMKASSRGVTSLTLTFAVENEVGPVGLPDFLAAVGLPLKILSVRESQLQLDDSMMLQYCPKLDELALCRHRVEARLNFCDYRATNQELPELGCDWDDVLALLTRLRDKSSPLAQCVRRLRVQLFDWGRDWDDGTGEVRNGPTSEDEINAMRRMLELNETLEYFDVVAPSSYRVDISNFQQYHLQPIM